MKIQYVASCWNYSRIATLSLSQFVLFPPLDHTCTVTICYCRDADPETAAVLDHFAANHAPRGIVWDFRDFERRRLMRRAIARNEIAKSTDADFVLFSDVDYMPSSPECLDETAAKIAERTTHKQLLMFPRFVRSSIDHSAGDSEIQKVTDVSVYSLERGKYRRAKLPRSIGGTQWVSGETARRFGYLPALRRFHRPADNWRRTFEDSAYRRFLARHSIFQAAIDVDGWHRIRHSKRGRFDIGVKL